MNANIRTALTSLVLACMLLPWGGISHGECCKYTITWPGSGPCETNLDCGTPPGSPHLDNHPSECCTTPCAITNPKVVKLPNTPDENHVTYRSTWEVWCGSTFCEVLSSNDVRRQAECDEV